MSRPEEYDVAIIGAGAVGCALARELSRYRLRILLLEAADDVATGATRANSGIVHGGYAARAGSRKARFALPGSRLFPTLANELDFPWRPTGSLVLAFSRDDEETLERIAENGRLNGLDDLEIWDRSRALDRIPRLNPDEVRRALYAPGAGIVSPYEYALALAENAVVNGVHLKTASAVVGLESGPRGIRLQTAGGEYCAGFVVNAAGVGAGDIAALAGVSSGRPATFTIRPRKGQYIIFRRGSAAGLDTVVFQPPTPKGKGILVTPTTWGNLLLGPDAQEVQDPSDLGTDPESLVRIVETARRSVKDFSMKDAIRVFSGNRPAADRGDFIIEWANEMPELLHLAGIESPGLTASPAIALEAVRMLREAGLNLKPDDAFNPRRRAALRPRPLESAAKAAREAALPAGDSRRLICRCEQIRETEILDALNRGIPVRSVDAVKRRTRAGMGACQGAFCESRVRNLLLQTGVPEDEILGPTRDRTEMKAQLDRTRQLLGDKEGAANDAI